MKGQGRGLVTLGPDHSPIADVGRARLKSPLRARRGHPGRATPRDSGKQEGKLSRLVETFHAARYLRLDRRCHISSHFSR